jgi:hypothetical protein
MKFDIFTIRQWREGYTLEVEKGRPRNAPRGKFTKADRKRKLASLRKTMELRERLFPTLEDVFEEIKLLEMPKADD